MPGVGQCPLLPWLPLPCIAAKVFFASTRPFSNDALIDENNYAARPGRTTIKVDATMHRWKLSTVAAAALVTVSLTATDAWALALGHLSIQSGQGEPLRAQVELPQITAAEA